MSAEIFAKTYYGNTVGDWGVALALIIGTFVLSKLLYWFFAAVLRKMTSRTRSGLDDIMVDLIERPVIFMVVVAGIRLALGTLHMPEHVAAWVGNGTQFMIIISITWLIVRLVEALFIHFLAPLTSKTATDLDDQLLPVLRKSAKAAIWALGIIIALNNAGYNVGALIAGLGIGGLALAMAAKDTVSNVFGGFTIFTDQPFTIRDRVRVAGFDGTVEEIGIRSTRLRTLAGTLVTMPNAKFSESAVENVTAEPTRKVTLNLGLTYDTKPDRMVKALEVLQEINGAEAGVTDEPKIGFSDFGESSLNIIYIYYIRKEADIIGTQSAVNMEILRRFNAEDLEFAFPTRTLYTMPA